MSQGEVPFDQHRVAHTDGDLSGARVGQHLGIETVGTTGQDVDPLRPAALRHEDQGPTIAFDHRARGHQDAVGETSRLEPDVGVHAGAQ